MQISNIHTPGAKIAIVIPTPSMEDDSETRKAGGASLLNSKLQSRLKAKLANVGILRHHYSILSVVQIRHPKINDISNEELACWTELLRRDLASLDVDWILSIGELPLRVLTGLANISKYNGSPLECTLAPGKFVLAIDSYDTAMSVPSWNPLTDFFLQKLARYQHTAKLPWKDINVIVTKDLELIRNEFLEQSYSWLAFDIESSYTEMTCIGFAKDENTAYVIPLVHMYGPRLGAALKLIQEILATDIPKIAQNGNFDLTYMAWKYKIFVRNFAWDTMLCMHSMFPNLPKGLDTVSAIFTDEAYWKDDGKQWKLAYDKVNWPEFFNYNGKDTANLLTIRKNQEELLTLRGTEATFKQEMELCYPLIFTELRGIAIDDSKKDELAAEAAENIRRWELYLNAMLGSMACNVRSPAQMAKLLYQDLKLPKRIRDGKISTDIDALTSLIPFAPEIIKPIIIIKSWLKESSEYKVPCNEDGRMRSTLKPAGTVTGRLASSKSITGSGTNFQNRSKKLRIFFIPDSQDHALVQVDYSKAESWIVAALAQDEKMLEALYGEDFHSTNASNFLGRKVTKDNYNDRQLGKRVSHGCWDGEAEVLTPTGWVKFADLQDNTEVAQWNRDTKEISFVVPSHVTREHHDGDMISMDGNSYSHYVTPDHRMISNTSSGYWTVMEAEDFIKRKTGRLPITGYKFEGTCELSDNELRLLVAIQADAHIDSSNAVKFRLRKLAKIDRLHKLLASYNYTETVDIDHTVCIRVAYKEISNIVDSFIGYKLFRPEMFYNLPLDKIKLVLQEVLLWDGAQSNDIRNRKEYITTAKHNAEVIQTIAHLAGLQSIVTETIREGRKTLYAVSFNSRQLARMETMKISRTHYTGTVYCVTVPTECFLVRRAGKIQVSMNCNYGMTAFLLQTVLLKDGYSYTMAETQALLDAYFQCYPKVRTNYHQWIQAELNRDRTLTNPFGRKITFWEPWGNQLLNAAYAWIPQGTVGDMTNRGLINCYNNLPEAELRLQVHDSVVLQVKKSDISAAFIRRLTDCMIIPMTIKGINISIPIDIELGDNWGKLTSWDKYKVANNL
jgi:DNA polymerase I-like protein with 3'-5' exonuclease and polymerase domains/uracil-DNA glycosylase